jgi:hypothetical protein
MFKLRTAIVIATVGGLLQAGAAAAQSMGQHPPQNATGPAPRVIRIAEDRPVPARQTAADSTAKASAPSSASSANDPVTPPSSSNSKIDAALDRLSPARLVRNPRLRRASAHFPAFCRDWERKLVQRTENNLQHIVWKLEHGYETGTYVSYSRIRSCTCKAGTRGVPIGELTYQEVNYQLAGKTIDEARHSKPRPVGITNTTEIFRWGGNKWVY